MVLTNKELKKRHYDKQKKLGKIRCSFWCYPATKQIIILLNEKIDALVKATSSKSLEMFVGVIKDFIKAFKA